MHRLKQSIKHMGSLGDRKSTRLNSSHSQISYAVFCLKKKKKRINTQLLLRNKDVYRTYDAVADVVSLTSRRPRFPHTQQVQCALRYLSLSIRAQSLCR